MNTRKARRIKRRRIGQVVAGLTAVGAIGLSVGVALPAFASDRVSHSNPACNSQYQQDSSAGRSHSQVTSNSNESFCD